MAIYTYEVDHGDESPRIGAGDKINGGKLTSVVFDSYISNAVEVKEKLEEYLFESDDIDREVFDKIMEIIRPL